MHFFVKNSNAILAERLLLGLQRLYDSGAYDRYMKEHTLTKDAFPLTKFKNARIIKLKNPNTSQTELIKYGLLWPNKK